MALYRIFTGVTCSSLITTELYSVTANGPSPVVGGVYSNGANYYSITQNNDLTSDTLSGTGPIDTNTNYITCPGVTSRAFAYNPTQSIINGTLNIGTLCVGDTVQEYSSNIGGLTWWGGPNENSGYCIGTVVPAQNQPTPFGNIGSVQFWRTPIFTQEAFTSLASSVTGQSFPTALSAQTYLNTNNYWTSIVIPLYSFTTFTFTPAGATANIGPTSLQTQTAYSAQTFYPTYFSNSSGKQNWTVPVTASYLIECVGASGGNGFNGVLGGNGAKITGTFSLSGGTVLRLIVGQSGQTQTVSSSGSGGGGGASLVFNSNTLEPLMIAGGGGGANNYGLVYLSGNPASLTATGNPGGNGGGGGVFSNGAGGTGGNGGGGFTGNGGASVYGTGGISLSGTALGGIAYISGNGNGGFGGGGGAGFSGGGGAGGYSGGNGGANGGQPPAGGGGGSYNTGASQSASIMITNGHGYITITKL